MTHTQIFVMRIRIRRRPSRPTRRASSLSDGQPLTRTLRRLTRAFSGYSQPLFLHVWLANCRAQSVRVEPSQSPEIEMIEIDTKQKWEG